MDAAIDSSNPRASKIHPILLFFRARILIAGLVGLILLLGQLPGFSAPAYVPGRLLVKFRSDKPQDSSERTLQRHGARRQQRLQKLDVTVVSVDESSSDRVLAELRASGDVEFAERDYLARVTVEPNDPLVSSGSAWHLPRIEAGEAWDVTAGNAGTIVAVLDSGVNASHPDLLGNLLPGYDFVNGDADPADDFGHGTAVIGTIAAVGNNQIGLAGVAFKCRVLPVKVVDASGFASYSCIAQGIRYAVDNGARVINLSIAGSAPSVTLQDAVDYAWSRNVVVIASAGNNASSVLQYPAACNHVIGVSATTPTDALASFSSFGDYVLLAAPGENIWTTQRFTNNPYGSWRGTSFASPLVAGVAALVAAENPTLSNQRIADLLKETAEDLGEPGVDPQFGFGLVNARAAVLRAATEPGALPPNPPLIPDEPVVASGDTNRPVVLLLEAPKNNARVVASTVRLAGSASDDRQLREVVVTVNGTAHRASGTQEWSADVALEPGLNDIRVQSVDQAGNFSVPVVRSVTCVQYAPLTVQTDGLGTVAANLDGKLLEIGRQYTVRAVPAPGQAFAGWNGQSGEDATLTFTMQPGLVLTARFVPSPFPPVKGSYGGLIANTNDVAPANAGSFTLNVTAGGRFTGKLTVDGTRFSVRGQFNLSGESTVTISRRDLAPLMLKLEVDLSGGTDQISGTLTDGAWVSTLAGDRNVFDARLNPPLQAGTRAFLLEQNGSQAMAAAEGSSVIARNGSVRVKGRLVDGRPFSAGSLLAKNGDCALYLPLNRGSETLIGWLNFPALPEPTASGTVIWVRSGTNAFAATLEATSIANASAQLSLR